MTRISFDSIWHRYQSGDIGPIEFLEGAKRRNGLRTFASWAESKIRQNRNPPTIQLPDVKKLAEDLLPIDRESSQIITQVFLNSTRQNMPRTPARERIEHESLSESDDDSFNFRIELFQGLTYSIDELVSAYSVISSIPLAEQEDLLTHSRPFFSNFQPAIFRARLVEALVKVPPNLRSHVLQQSRLLRFCNEDEFIRVWFVKVAAELSSDRELLDRFIVFVNDSKSPTDQRSLLFACSQIPEGQRAHVLLHAIPLLTHIHDTYCRTRFIEAVTSVPENQRAEFLRQITPLLERSTVLIWYDLVQFLKDIPQDGLAELIPLLFSLYASCYNEGFSGLTFVTNLKSIKIDELTRVLRQALSIINHQMDDDALKIAVLHEIARIAPDERDEVLGLATPLFDERTPHAGKLLFIRDIASIPRNERVDLITAMTPLLLLITDCSTRGELLLNFIRAPIDQRMQAISGTHPLFQRIQDPAARDSLAKSLSHVAPQQISSVIAKVRDRDLQEIKQIFSLNARPR